MGNEVFQGNSKLLSHDTLTLCFVGNDTLKSIGINSKHYYLSQKKERIYDDVVYNQRKYISKPT